MKSLVCALLSIIGLAAADSDGFVPMFNGRDLSGWVNANCAPETWSVTNGMIHCTGFPTGALRTERQYENFIMEAEWRHLSKGGNSGIFLWGTPIAAPGVPFLRGIEVQVLDNDYTVDGKNQWYTTHGDVFPIHGATMKPFGRHNGQRSFPSEERSKPSPEWNHYRIVASNGVVRLSVNGKEVSGGEECNYRKGYLALESEGGPVQFRNVRIQEFPSSNPPAELIAPVDAGFRPLFTGLDFRGWKTNAHTAGRWAVEGERLRLKAGTASHENTLWTEKTFTNGAILLDVQIPKEGQATPIIQLRGTSASAFIELEGATPGGFTRFELTFAGYHYSIKRNGQDIVKDKPLPSIAPTAGSIGLRDIGTAMTFMNLQVREN